MSKQLTLSATLAVLAMAALAFGTLITTDRSGSAGDGAATAHGSLVKVLVRA